MRTTVYVKDHLFEQYKAMFPDDNLSQGVQDYIRDRLAGYEEPKRVCAMCRAETGLVALCDGCGEQLHRPITVSGPPGQKTAAA